MKIAVTGKGGVGKTTIVALLARILRDAGNTVLAIDADPDMNLPTILGVPENATITPIIELKELIAERTGTEVGKSAPFFTMNPKVDDIPEKYCIDHQGIKLLVMGTVKSGGGGCACPENAFLKQLLSHLMLQRKEWVLLDMEAGIEHLGRATAIGVDEMIVVVEPSQASLETAHRVKKLANDIGIKRLRLIGNKVLTANEETFLADRTQDFDKLGYIHLSEEMRKINTREASALDITGAAVTEMKQLLQNAGWITP
ncbi:AAA family ATPase [candidate division KSB3 bacterium]|uniref:AAA family ATPase n=1 Tax=candidate division KSB3 bacterium TaxID=2044937 RepID=A0A9D5JV05_9BACT|nr:AAA family ATPase [candidate division KSB3 bacterium]MBD3324759.1 AAA family ATPase [candidate division KSB3 bacterium]